MKNVSAIIPNFNYSRLLERRLKTVISQTVRPGEIIFLDDKSSDNSVEMAERLLSQCDIPWRIIKNESNQGVFKQWLKGFNLARYDHIWIAEADDYCELNFVEKVMAAFNDEKVVLSYCQSKFDDLMENETGRYYDYITRYFDYSTWTEDYIVDGRAEIESCLCCINTIPNASSVIFDRRLIDLDKAAQVGEYRYNGDWLFYIISLSSFPGNRMSYYSEPLNYFVRHQASVFGKGEKSTRPIDEFLGIMLYVLERFSIQPSVMNVMLKSLIGNLLYWPEDDELNDLANKVMAYLPSDNYHSIYKQEVDFLTVRHEIQIHRYECSIKERDETISRLELALNQSRDNSPLTRLKKITKALLPVKRG